MVVPKKPALNILTSGNHSENNLVKNEKTTSTENVNPATTGRTKNDSVALDIEICENASKQTINEENMSYIHRLTAWYNEKWSVPFSYLFGVPFGWLLLGVFQYFVCVVNLGDSLLDPWFFTCAWIVEAICLLHMTMILSIIKCLYVRTKILKYCDKITWVGFTFLLFQGLVIVLLLLPMSNLFKQVFGDFSTPINFFIYWLTIAFPHFMILCFVTFGCCSKYFRKKVTKCLQKYSSPCV